MRGAPSPAATAFPCRRGFRSPLGLPIPVPTRRGCPRPAEVVLRLRRLPPSPAARPRSRARVLSAGARAARCRGRGPPPSSSPGLDTSARSWGQRPVLREISRHRLASACRDTSGDQSELLVPKGCFQSWVWIRGRCVLSAPVSRACILLLGLSSCFFYERNLIAVKSRIV